MANLSGALTYFDTVHRILEDVVRTQVDAIDQAAAAMVKTIQADGMIYMFGTGHSHMLAVEGHFRAGGLAPMCAILKNEDVLMHKGAQHSSASERQAGLSKALLAEYNPKPVDTLVVFSNSGVNIVPVEMALAGKEAGMTVIAFLSRDYEAKAKLSAVGKRLSEVADIVLDNRGIQGDAVVTVGDSGLKVAATSTVVGAFMLNAIVAEVATRIAASGEPVPAYISSNVPGAPEHNASLIERYRERNPHL